MRKLKLLVPALAVAGMLFAAVPAAHAATTAVKAVETPTTAWSPSQITIAAGDSVSFTWGPSAGTSQPHNVSFDDGQKSGAFAASGNYTRTFAAAGSFPFKCEVHPTMTGTVTVGGVSATPAAGATPAAAPRAFPNTGPESNLFPYAGALLLAASGAWATIARRRRS